MAASRPASPRSSATCRRRFLAALGESFPNAAVTVDWFHVVQIFTTAVDEVRKAEARSRKLPKAIRWAVLKAGDGSLTDDQRIALAELESGGLATATAWRAKEMLRWIRQADSTQAARWRITRFINHIGRTPRPRALLDPVRKALAPSPPTSSASSSAGPHPTPTPASKPSTASSRPPERAPVAIETPPPTSPSIYLLAAPLTDILKSI